MDDGERFGQISFWRDIYIDLRLIDISTHKLKSQADVRCIFTGVQTVGVRQQLRQWLDPIFYCSCQHLTQLTANKGGCVVSDGVFLVT